MKITIHGADYSAALDASRPLSITRRLNEPSECEFLLSLPRDGSMETPLRYQYVIVSGDDGTVYFTGYIAASPLPEYAGNTQRGPRYRYLIQALSDELISDQELVASTSLQSGQTVAQLLSNLIRRAGTTGISAATVTLAAKINNVISQAGARWSEIAGSMSGQARAALRVVSGVLTAQSIGSTVHTMNESAGTLNPAHLSFSSSTRRAFANDVTVCGAHEPWAWVTEYFQGDGSTAEFYLAEDPFFLSSGKSTIIEELFNESSFDMRRWSVAGAGYFSQGAGGLTMYGGNGDDGEAVVSWLSPVELGGTLLLEASGITLQSGSSGVVAAIYTSDLSQQGCICGFQVTTQSGNVVLQPVVNGSSVGTGLALNSANQYILRIRLWCAEMQRDLSIYRSWGDEGAITAGGKTNNASARVLMDVQSSVDGVVGMPVTVYEGTIASLSDIGIIVAASSMSLVGTMRALRMRSLGSAWVETALSGATAGARRLGTTGEGSECHVERTGKLSFYTGYTPPAGMLIAVHYRTSGRAVGRAVNTASQAALKAAGSPSEAAWIGTVSSPVARSSADCRNAASVIAQAAASTSALWAGRYKANNRTLDSDVWPGDALELVAESLALDVQVVVRSVKLTYTASLPDLVMYEMAFANDWVDDLAIRTSETVPEDAWLPAAVSPEFCENLNALRVTAVSGSTVSIDTGVSPPTGGGFEVRRRDYCFQAGNDTDLLLRTTTENFMLARQTDPESFYIRMYDGATPPNYSEFSSVVVVNLPLSS